MAAENQNSIIATTRKTNQNVANTTEAQNDEIFSCGYCSFKVNSIASLKEHLQIHHINGIDEIEKNYETTIRHTDSLHSKRVSENQIQLGTTKDLKCYICGKVFKTKQKLQRHLSTVHGEEKNIQCDICKKMFKTQDDLTIHHKFVHDLAR